MERRWVYSTPRFRRAAGDVLAQDGMMVPMKNDNVGKAMTFGHDEADWDNAMGFRCLTVCG
jgi:hypothetical protein